MRTFSQVLLLGFAFLFACDRKMGNGSSKISGPFYDRMLKKSGDFIQLHLDEKTPNISMGMQYYFQSKPWLFNLNQHTNTLQMFDLEKEKLHKKITFKKEGEQGVGRIFGFYVHNLDSIFLFPPHQGKVFLTDTSKVIRNVITYETPLKHTPAFVLSSYFSSKPVVNDGKMIVKTHVEGDHKKINDQELSEKYLSYSIDLQNGKVDPLPHHYPAGYLSEGKRHFEASFAVSPSKMVYSLYADHSLYYANAASSDLKSKLAVSKYLENDFENYPLSGTGMEKVKYFSGSPHYESLLYDPYRKVYYRFCFPKVKAEGEKAIKKLRIYPKLFSIMILNEDLNIIGETLMDKDKYYPNNCFVAKEGLYISINHADNPRNKEDYLTFDLLELKDVD